MDTGRAICFFIFISSFLSNSLDLRKFLSACCRRCYDRKWSMRLKRDPDDSDDDEPNTRKLVQDDLIELYKGSTFQGQ